MPKITVIVPVYQVEPFLQRCVDSILNQTFTDFELILVDDGSPDGCGALCDESINPQITVIHQPNGGLSAARNTGIDWAFACSDSQWLAFVDSDDWVHEKYLEYLYRGVMEHHTEISMCDYEETDGTSQQVCADAFDTTVVDGLELFASKKNVVATVAWNKLYQKELFSQLRYPVGKIHEDEYTTYKLLAKAGRVTYLQVPLYHYYINQQGITRSGYSIRNLDVVAAIEEQCSFFRSIGRNEYYRRWVINLLFDIYPMHLAKLHESGEKKKAHELRVRGRKLWFQNRGVIKQQDVDKRKYAFGIYFPHANGLVMPICNLSHMLYSDGLRETLRYYKQKSERFK